jgi:hypothetical protein
MGGHKTLYGCPNCYTSFAHEGSYTGTHHEDKCPHCGQDLQWDEPTQSAGHGLDTISGPPEPCPHQARKRQELWFPHFQNDGSRAESVAKWKSDGVAEKLTELFEQARTAQRLGTELASSHPSGIPTAIFSLPTFGSGGQG